MNNSELWKEIKPIDQQAQEECQRRWNAIAKPLHSLGRLEELLIKIAGLTGDARMHFEKKALIVMCADNGVVAEGVTQTGQEVTAIVAENFQKGAASAAIMCQSVGADIFPVDIGVASDTSILQRKIRYGTGNIAVEPAMTREEAEDAILVGISLVKELKEKGYGIIATGEMGIGNTTTSSAVASILLEEPVEQMTGRGAGLSSEGLNHKIAVIKEAIALHRPEKNDPVDVLAKVGGLDIAGLAGVFLGGAIYQIPIVIDGFISSVAALAASRICPACSQAMIASHVSKEPASRMILAGLGQEACLHCEMCLGEGTGAVTLFPILDMACAVYQGMTTFEDNQIEEYVEQK
ncbi:MAG: nicotinate-nucleotide--dimethylbenzimidazole phosphoribosyltransferase [Hespellia sp.]|nr:nicotinate-nucleotide--dimethylbenzimidazole phosphoribosyltransferase [Hespellia sp.]